MPLQKRMLGTCMLRAVLGNASLGSAQRDLDIGQTSQTFAHLHNIGLACMRDVRVVGIGGDFHQAIFSYFFFPR